MYGLTPFHDDMCRTKIHGLVSLPEPYTYVLDPFMHNCTIHKKRNTFRL